MYFKYSLFLCFLFVWGLAGCVAPKSVLPDEYTASQIDIPDKWKDEPYVVLSDEEHYTLKQNAEFNSLEVIHTTWYYVQSAKNDELKSLVAYDFESIENPAQLTATAFFADGATKRKKGMYRFRLKNEGIDESNGWGTAVTFSRYTDGMIIKRVIKRSIFKPEHRARVFMRSMVPVLHKKVVLEYPTSMKIKYGVENSEKLKVTFTEKKAGTTQRVTLESRELHKIDRSDSSYLKELWYCAFYMSLPPVGTRSMSWAEIGNYYYKQIEQNLTGDANIRHFASQIKGRNKTDKLKEGFNLLKRTFRYHADERAYHAYIPRDVKKIVKTGLADCKELASMYKAILREVGVDVELVLVNNGGLQQVDAYPGLGYFNHMIARVKTDDGYLYIDPTIQKAEWSNSYYPLIGRKVVALTTSGAVPDSIVGNPDLNVVETKNSIYQDKKNKRWRMKGTIDLEGTPAFYFYMRYNAIGQEMDNLALKDFLAEAFKIVSDEIIIKDLTSDKVTFAYDADFHKNYIEMDAGGFQLNTPYLYNKEFSYTTRYLEGPRMVHNLIQKDSWKLPRGYRDLEAGKVTTDFCSGKWRRKKRTVSRKFALEKRLFYPHERKEKIRFYKDQQKFIEGIIWK
ncbi:MAG: transglutaminase domain-containing protein [Fibrobacterales bacterium]